MFSEEDRVPAETLTQNPQQRWRTGSRGRRTLIQTVALSTRCETITTKRFSIVNSYTCSGCAAGRVMLLQHPGQMQKEAGGLAGDSAEGNFTRTLKSDCSWIINAPKTCCSSTACATLRLSVCSNTNSKLICSNRTTHPT